MNDIICGVLTFFIALGITILYFLNLFSLFEVSVIFILLIILVQLAIIILRLKGA